MNGWLAAWRGGTTSVRAARPASAEDGAAAPQLSMLVGSGSGTNTAWGLPGLLEESATTGGIRLTLRSCGAAVAGGGCLVLAGQYGPRLAPEVESMIETLDAAEGRIGIVGYGATRAGGRQAVERTRAVLVGRGLRPAPAAVAIGVGDLRARRGLSAFDQLGIAVLLSSLVWQGTDDRGFSNVDLDRHLGVQGGI